ncbi:MAG: hypothetical protein LBQ00_02240 [Syntrophobacterales bacterium]|jgi:hypothetical protein|nr:hypothetical protein [Syntrophobacterales bacterium]
MPVFMFSIMGVNRRGLPKEYGSIQSILGLLDGQRTIFCRKLVRLLQERWIIEINGCFKKTGPQPIGKTRGGWNTKIYMVVASDRNAVVFSLSSGEAGDAPDGAVSEETFLLMDRAYEGDETRSLAVLLGFSPLVPPNKQSNKTLEI